MLREVGLLNLRIYICTVLAALLTLGCLCLPSFAYPEISAESAILMEASGGRVIYERNSTVSRLIASTTKIMTAVVTLEAYAANGRSLDEAVQVNAGAVGIEGSSIYLAVGESYTMRELLCAMLLESANDAAAAIALEVAGSIDDFAALMNQKATELGMIGTNYANPHGLDDENNYSTAFDLAILAAHALNNADFRTMVSTQKQVITTEDNSKSRLLVNHNKLLRLYDGAIGVKTGFTKASGRCLVSAAEREGVTLICVTLGAPDDWNDHAALYDYGFEKFDRVELSAVGEDAFVMPVVGGEADFIHCRNNEPLYAVLPTDEIAVEREVELKRFYYAPISEGEVLGYVTFRNGGEVVGRVEIVAENAVGVAEEKSIFDRISDWFKEITQN